ncbi:MAG: hypothetical protein M2R45_03784 [Verrucomicrobia subdivision 3 bacterium]|nr:hypothetical protein [Limisphaerales bacterium]MCS1416775.1 hypothetical protein [Limisphaerales bacterium]
MQWHRAVDTNDSENLKEPYLFALTPWGSIIEAVCGLLYLVSNPINESHYHLC